MESESQVGDDGINKRKLKSWVRYTSVVCLVGERACEMAEELVGIFKERGIVKLATLEDLVTLQESRSKIVVCDDVSLIKSGIALMCFSVDAFGQLVRADDKSFSINGHGMYRSFSLECSKVHLYGDARTAKFSAAITENNGHEVGTAEEADIVIYDGGTRSEQDINGWIFLREQMRTNARLLHGSVFNELLLDYTANLSSILERGQNGLFTNFLFFEDNLQQFLIKKIEEEDGKVTKDLDEAFFVVGDSMNEKLILQLYLKKNRCVVVSEKIISDTCLEENLNGFLENRMPLPQMPMFYNVRDFDGIHLYPDPGLNARDMANFIRLSEELDFTIAESVEECHGVIVPIVATTEEDELGVSPDIPPRRSIMCLQEMKNGPHSACSIAHFPHYIGDKLEKLKTFNIAGIKADAVMKEFVQRILEGVGLIPTEKLQKKGNDIVLVDTEVVKEKGRHLSTLRNNGVLLLKIDLVVDLISSPVNTIIDDYHINLDDLRTNVEKCAEDKTEKPKTNEKAANPSIIPPSPDLFPSTPPTKRDQADEDATARKKIKLDWDVQDEMARVSKTRYLFGALLTQRLRFSPLQLDVGRVYITQLLNFPVTDSPISMSLTFKADHLKTNTGVVNDFSNHLTQTCQSPIVGGVFYDYTQDLVDQWGEKLFGFLAKIFQEMGVCNMFCREVIEEERGKDLFIVLGEEQVDLCCFRTLDKQTDRSVTSCSFTASKFWIPERITDIFVSKTRLPFGLTSPHVMINCGEDCFCERAPMDMLGKLVAYSCHIPENAPKVARKGVLAYLIRTGELSGTVFHERDGVGIQVEGENSEDFVNKLVATLDGRCDSIVGEGKVACDACFRQDGFINVCKIDGVQLKCYQCGQECSTGVLVLD